jgi:hypothetical protein
MENTNAANEPTFADAPQDMPPRLKSFPLFDGPSNTPVTWQLPEHAGGESAWRVVMLCEAAWRVAFPHFLKIAEELAPLDRRTAARIYGEILEALAEAVDATTYIDEVLHHPNMYATPTDSWRAEEKLAELVRRSRIDNPLMVRALTDLEYQAAV